MFCIVLLKPFLTISGGKFPGLFQVDERDFFILHHVLVFDVVVMTLNSPGYSYKGLIHIESGLSAGLQENDPKLLSEELENELNCTAVHT